MNRIALALTLLLSACSTERARPPLEGAAIGGPFTLTNGQGQTVTDRTFAGRWRIMYFGYTFCPDVCPTDMANLAGGLRELAKTDAAKAKNISLVFVSVDPQRDTPPVVKQFAAAFGPQAIGLTGTQAQVDAIKKAYAVYSRKRDGSSPSAYLVDHSRGTYLMDPQGKPVALLPSEQSPAAVADALRKWVT